MEKISTPDKVSSLSVFLRYIKKDSLGKVDGDQILSRNCFEDWLNSRPVEPKNPPEAFRKAIFAHCAASNGRRPFLPEHEAAVLQAVRKKQIWECFRGHNNIGIRGTRIEGYWERNRKRKFISGTVKKASAKEVKRERKSSRTSLEETSSITHLNTTCRPFQDDWFYDMIERDILSGFDTTVNSSFDFGCISVL